MSTKLFNRIAIVALPLAALGCTQSTTSDDVADARQDVIEEQQDVDEARHEAMKPTIDEDAAEDIREEQKDVAEAQGDLAQTQQKFAATQARDAFALEAQKLLDEADRQIEALENRADGESDAAKAATQVQIDDLKARRDRLDQAVDDMNGAELMKWSDHRDNVQTAIKELTDKLNDVG